MAFCIYCGKQLLDGASFCTSCGKPVYAAAPAPAQAPQQPAAQKPPMEPAQHESLNGEAPNEAGIDWERFQSRTSPKSANRLILAASVLVFAVVLLVWTLLIR